MLRITLTNFIDLLNIKKQRSETFKIYNRNRKIKKNYLPFYKFILIILKMILVDLITAKKVRKINKFYSEINLVVKGSGTQSLLSNSFSQIPSEVYINGISKDISSCNKTCILDENINNITLKFNEDIETCSNMFYNCENITYIDLSHLDASKIISMRNMFNRCTNLEEINFGNIDSSSVEDMSGLFSYCFKLTSINLSNLNISRVKDINNLFAYCSNLETIDFGNIDTSSVENMNQLFSGCYKLKSIDLSNFNTSKVKFMSGMFQVCRNLETIDFGNIDTSSVVDMSGLFNECTKLTSINLSNLDTSKVKIMGLMFSHCTNLKSIDFGNIDTSSVEDMSGLFESCTNLTSLDLSNLNFSKIWITDLMFGHCINLKYINLKNYDFSKNIRNCFMFEDCYSLIYLKFNSLYLYYDLRNLENLYNEKHVYDIFCFERQYSVNLFQQLERLSDYFDLCYNKSLTFDILNNTNDYNYEVNQIILNECPKEFYIEWYGIFGMEQLKYFITAEGYYLDINNNTYKKCYKNCKYCYGEGNATINNCKICINNYKFSEGTNCVKKCDKYYYIDEYNEYQCVESCSGEYNKLIKEKNKCIDDCTKDDIYQSEYNNICYTYSQRLQLMKNENLEMLVKESIFSFVQELYIINNTNDKIDLNVQDKVQEKIKDLMKTGLNLSAINDKDDIVINVDSVNYTITTTQNQQNIDKINTSTIDLGECEDKLKDEYNISKNDSLYILKVDLEIDKIHKVEYEVYYPFFTNNLTQLNMSICEDIKIDISIPFEIPKEEVCKYNISSECYNSICYTSTSKDGTDEPYKDRQDNYKKNNSLKVCEEYCEFIEYDDKNQKAICSCFTKIKLPMISEIKIDEEKMYSNFKNIKNIANIKMLECINLFLNLNNIFKNSSNYMTILLMLLSLVSLFAFICHNNLKIKNSINQFCQKNNIIKNINNNINKTKPIKRGNFTKRKNISVIKNNNKNISGQLMNNQNQNKNSPISLNNVNSKNNLIAKNLNNFTNKNAIIKGKNKRRTYKKIINTRIITNNLSKSKSTSKLNTQLNSKTKINEIKILNDYEYNSLKYEEAKTKDRRSYCQYYFSLLRTKHILIFTFCQFGDYNSKPIKIYIFFLTLAINYIVSAMFYSDATMHKINKDKGSFDFTYQLPIMAYSMLISAVLKTLINTLGLYEEEILSFKNSKNRNLVEGQKVLYRIKCKILLFFIITYNLIFFFWIFLGCFCAVYKNTQIHLLIDVSSSFGLSFITPFFINLLPGVFRIPSLKGKIKRPYLFRFSKLLQFI